MILAIDIGNTNIVVGCVNDHKDWYVERISTDQEKTSLEYAVLFRTILDVHNESPDEIEGVILSSVVPSLNSTISQAVEKVLPGRNMLVVGPGMKTGIKIAIDNPAQLGADMVVGAVAGLHEHKGPLIIIDMGTATTISAIDEKGTFLGCTITPGLRVSMRSLVSNTSQLTLIGLDAPTHCIGTNTSDSMRAGIIFGCADQLDGMIDRMEKEMGKKTTVLATGGLARFIVPYCRHEILVDDGLLIKGLYLLYMKNRG